jgi:lysophospholipase L1-like esterase
MRKILAHPIVVALLGTLIGVGAAYLVMPSGELNVSNYGRQRWKAVKQHITEAGEGYVLLVGDSHAEMSPPQTLSCGPEVVNAGLTGATVEVYSKVVDELQVSKPPGAIVLMIGTNNLFVKREPFSISSKAEFKTSTRELISKLRPVSPRLIVSAIPPISEEMTQYFDSGNIQTYSLELAALCQDLQCEFVDPWNSLRTATFAIAKPGALADGIHAQSYKDAFRSIDERLCRSPRR